MSKISKEVLEMSDRIKATLTVDKKTGVGNEVDEQAAFRAALPESITEDMYNECGAFTETFIAAATHGAAALAIDAMSGNTKLDEVSFSLSVGKHNHYNLSVPRESHVRDPSSGDKSITKYGMPRVGFVTEGAKNRGDLKKVRVEAMEAALKALGK